MGEIHSGALLATPELQGGGVSWSCSELGVNVGGEVEFSMGWCRLGLYECTST